MSDSLTIIRVADAETTGFDDPAELIEIGWTDLRRASEGWLIESGPQATLVNPGMPISFPAMAVHHISEAEAASGIDPDIAREILVAGVDLICTHNFQFDNRFIRTEKAAICTFKCARTAWPDLQSHGNGAIRYELGLCLGDDRAYPPHRAGPDTWVTAHILLELMKVYSIETMLAISAMPVVLRKIDFGEHAGKPFSAIPESYLDWIVNKSKMPSDPTREDVVYTARREIALRAEANTQQQTAPAEKASEDLNAWRSQVQAPKPKPEELESF